MATPSAPALPRTPAPTGRLQVRDLLAGLDGEGVVVDDGQFGHGPDVWPGGWVPVPRQQPPDRLHEIADRGYGDTQCTGTAEDPCTDGPAKPETFAGLDGEGVVVDDGQFGHGGLPARR